MARPVIYSNWSRTQTVISVLGVGYFAVVCVGQRNWLALAILVSHGFALVGWATAQNTASAAFRGWSSALDAWERWTREQSPSPSGPPEGT